MQAVGKRTLDEAKKRLGVEDTRHVIGGPVFWRPPTRSRVVWVSAPRGPKYLRERIKRDKKLAREAAARSEPAEERDGLGFVSGPLDGHAEGDDAIDCVGAGGLVEPPAATAVAGDGGVDMGVQLGIVGVD